MWCRFWEWLTIIRLANPAGFGLSHIGMENDVFGNKIDPGVTINKAGGEMLGGLDQYNGWKIGRYRFNKTYFGLVVSIDQIHHNLSHDVFFIWLTFGNHKGKSNKGIIGDTFCSVIAV